jgi:hypothetical protein
LATAQGLRTHAAKALINQLPTPYFKLALIDRRLLANSDRVAHRR